MDSFNDALKMINKEDLICPICEGDDKRRKILNKEKYKILPIDSSVRDKLFGSQVEIINSQLEKGCGIKIFCPFCDFEMKIYRQKEDNSCVCALQRLLYMLQKIKDLRAFEQENIELKSICDRQIGTLEFFTGKRNI